MEISCGIYLYNLKNHSLLIGHVTNAGNRFSIPKGHLNKNDGSYISCAKREFYEETNIDCNKLNILFQKEFNFVVYKTKKKKLKGFLFIIDEDINKEDICCNSFFEDKNGKKYPELDYHKWISLKDAEEILPISQIKNIPEIREIVEKIEIFS